MTKVDTENTVEIYQKMTKAIKEIKSLAVSAQDTVEVSAEKQDVGGEKIETNSTFFTDYRSNNRSRRNEESSRGRSPGRSYSRNRNFSNSRNRSDKRRSRSSSNSRFSNRISSSGKDDRRDDFMRCVRTIFNYGNFT